jgi:hypothetical protein
MLQRHWSRIKGSYFCLLALLLALVLLLPPSSCYYR